MNVIGYVRVSTDDQADSGAGLLAQRAAITEECRRRGWGLVAIHSDTASARSLNARPGLATALSEIDRGAAEALVVAKLDRLSRSLLDFSATLAGANANSDDRRSLATLNPAPSRPT